jgi:hypothetical protein
MAKKTSGFTIRESELATTLEITRDELDKIVIFFDADPNDRWELKENDHFIYLNKILKERLFSEQGAYAIAKYIDETQPQSVWARIKEFITKHQEKIRNGFINQKILDNCSSLTLRNNRHFLSKKDVVSIFCTSHLRVNTAFEEIKISDSPLILSEDFDDVDGVRYYSFSGLNKLSRHLAKALTVKDRRSWCEAIEVVGKKTFKLITDAETAKKKRIDTAMDRAKKRDKSQCKITGKKRDKENKGINITVHHIYDRHHYPHLADCEDNLITLSQEVHNDFHTWNGGSQKPCTADDLIKFAQQLHSDNYEVILRLNKIKQILYTQSPSQ